MFIPVGAFGDIYLELKSPTEFLEASLIESPISEGAYLFKTQLQGRWNFEGDIEFKENDDNLDVPPPNEILTIVSSFTADHLLSRLEWFFHEFDQSYNIQLGNYHQVFQELIAAQGIGKESKSDIYVVLNRFEDYIQGEQGKEVYEVLDEVYEKLIISIKEHPHDSKLIIVLLPVNERVVAKEVLDYIYGLYSQIKDVFKAIPTVYTIDLIPTQNTYPSLTIFDELTDEIAHIPYTEAFFVLMAEKINRLIWSLKQTPCKVIALDCDNTL